MNPAENPSLFTGALRSQVAVTETLVTVVENMTGALDGLEIQNNELLSRESEQASEIEQLKDQLREGRSVTSAMGSQLKKIDAEYKKLRDEYGLLHRTHEVTKGFRLKHKRKASQLNAEKRLLLWIIDKCARGYINKEEMRPHYNRELKKRRKKSKNGGE